MGLWPHFRRLSMSFIHTTITRDGLYWARTAQFSSSGLLCLILVSEGGSKWQYIDHPMMDECGIIPGAMDLQNVVQEDDYDDAVLDVYRFDRPLTSLATYGGGLTWSEVEVHADESHTITYKTCHANHQTTLSENIKVLQMQNGLCKVELKIEDCKGDDVESTLKKLGAWCHRLASVLMNVDCSRAEKVVQAKMFVKDTPKLFMID